MTALLLSSGLHLSAVRTPGKAAIKCGPRVLSFAELAQRARRICGAAQASGVRAGDRVAILAPNCIEYPELVIGLSDAGAVVATLNPRSTAHEITAVCDDCEAMLLFIHPEINTQLESARFATVRRIIRIDAEYEAWLQSAAESGPLPTLKETDPFTLVYSSGTTGKPKGILISHRSRTLTFHAMAMEYGCYGPDDLQLGIAPMAHGAGFAFAMATLFFGGTVEVLPRFDAALVLGKLATEPFTGVFMVPTHFQAIFALPAPELARYRGSARALRTIMCNAAALPYAVKQKIVDYWGEGKLNESYGSTEAGIVTNLRPADQLTRPKSVGRAFALNAIRLLDESGTEVKPGEVGELYSRSPYLFIGYWGQLNAPHPAFRDGWVSAGDLARQDADGFYYIVDRKNDMVITGGINVYPREIEEVLHQHAAVLEAAVIGVPDEYFGEALHAYVVVRLGLTVEVSELDRHCRSVLAGYKIPKVFRFIGFLPRNAGGKVLKGELRKNAA